MSPAHLQTLLLDEISYGSPSGCGCREIFTYSPNAFRRFDSEGTMPRSKKATLKRKSAGIKKNRTSQAVSEKSTSAGKSRAEGIRLFALAGRPSKEDFVKVYGP